DTSVAGLVGAVGRLSPRTYLLALGLHLTIYLVRAFRFSALLPAAERPPFAGVLAASAAHNLAAYVLPAKTGEATLVVYLRGHSGVAASAGLATLLVSRLLDLATLLGLVGGLVLALGSEFEGRAAATSPWLGGGLLLLSGAIAAVCARPAVLARVASGLGRRVGLARSSVGQRLLERLGRLSEALTRSVHRRSLGVGVLCSLAIWALVFAFYALLGRATGLPGDLGYARSAFGASLAVLFNLLPINGFAGFGTQEAGWKVGYLLIGVDGAVALASGFAVHLIQLANVVLLGLLGHAALPLVGAARRRAGE
ncbi:MAG: lysylphosphatidylglycerol synthase domain-containing protein, partial [Planctomycetota bacterium]